MKNYNVSKLDKTLVSGIKKLQKRYNFNISDTGRTLLSEPTENDILTVNSDNKQAIISHKTKASFFRGFGHIIENEENGIFEFSKTEEVQFNFNGLMYDCSRNAVLNIERTKDFLEMMAIMGHTVYMPYMEDVYELPNENFFGYMRGRYSVSELKEIDDYAFDLGIEVIPCIQTLAHLAQFTRWDNIKSKYSDTDDILIVGSNDTKSLIDKMFNTLSSTLRSKTIHVGMDEAYNLGRGQYLDKNGYEPKQDIMKRHLKDVLEIANKYGLTPIVWDDMFFKHYAQTSENKNVKPKEIRLMYWDYYNNTKQHYIDNLNKRLKMDSDSMFAGGSWRWVGYAPHHTKTIISTNASLDACKDKKIKNVITTAWADDGGECPASTCMLGVTLFGEHGYNRYVDIEQFKKRLKFCTGLSYETYIMQEEFDMLPGTIERANVNNPSKYLFYQDPLCGIFEYYTNKLNSEDVTNHFEKIENYFSEHIDDVEDIKLKATFKLYKCFAKVMKLKWNLGINIINSYKDNDKLTLLKIIEQQIKPLIDYLEDFKFAVYELWYIDNKGFGFEILDIRYGGMISRLNTAICHIQKYIDGDIDEIPELEENRQKIKDSDNLENTIHFNQYSYIASAGRMQW